jgi:predicted N-formylglutamate amidohydrolase
MNHTQTSRTDAVVEVLNAGGAAQVVVVCEHASHFIPPEFDDLGLSPEALTSHAAWDPGALPVAETMALALGAPLVASRVSRLVYDCNRPPDAPDAMPVRSEVIEIPGNAGLDDAGRAARISSYYRPFQAQLAATLGAKSDPAVVTVHSFTPVYHGAKRQVEIGRLHDHDSRLADAMLACADRHSRYRVERNAPYGPQDGVTHTLREHALPQKRLNVMIEIRNDLIATPQAQKALARQLAPWVAQAIQEAGAVAWTA